MAQVTELLIRKLEMLGPLQPDSRSQIEMLPITIRSVEADQDLVRDGDSPTDCLLLLKGFVCRYKTLENGGRQIMSFHIPGDLCDLHSLAVGRMDHSLGTMTPVTVGVIPHSALHHAMRQTPALTNLLWADTMLDAAIFREWVVNVGRRTAFERIAHLLCEIVTRLRAAGLARDYQCVLPITQNEIADATGLSTVHVNRTLQELRGRGLIALQYGNFVALDWPGLKQAAGFDPKYLHPLAGAA